MVEIYQCQLCSEKCKDAQQFLNHFETHTNQNEGAQIVKQNIIHKNESLESKSGKDSNCKTRSSSPSKKIRRKKNIETHECEKSFSTNCISKLFMIK